MKLQPRVAVKLYLRYSEVCPADKLRQLLIIAITFYEVKNFTWSEATNFTLQELHCGETTTSLDKDTLHALRLVGMTSGPLDLIGCLFPHFG